MTRVVCLGVLVVSVIAGSGCSASKQSYLERGNKLFAEGKYDDAVLKYRVAIQKDAGFGEAYYRLGLAAAKLNQTREAYSALFRAVQLLPENAKVKEKFADVCLSVYLADPQHPQVLYNQIGKLSDDFLSKNRNSYEGLMLKGYLASTDRKAEGGDRIFPPGSARSPGRCRCGHGTCAPPDSGWRDSRRRSSWRRI